MLVAGMVGALVLGTQVPATAAQAGVRPPDHRDVPSQVPVGALLSAIPTNPVAFMLGKRALTDPR